MCRGILPFRDNLPNTPYQQECEFPQSKPVGRRESFWNCFDISFGSVLLATIYWHLTYFHNVSLDLIATVLYFRKLSHLRSDILPTTPIIRVPLISASLLPNKRIMRMLLVGYVELGRLSNHASALLFAETFKLSGIFIPLLSADISVNT
jgi:hypothetical protein